MSLTVRFWDSDGNQITRRSNLPQNVAVSAYGTTAFGFPAPGTAFRFSIDEVGFISESTGYPTATAIIRNLPNNRAYTLKVVGSYSLAGQESTEIPFTVGTAVLPSLPAPNKDDDGGFDWTTFMYVGLGLLALIGAGWVFLNSRFLKPKKGVAT